MRTNNEENEKVYFLPGDLVTLKKGIDYKPTMIVVKKVTKYVKDNPYFQGILCRWFTTEGLLQETIWNTKDLQKL